VLDGSKALRKAVRSVFGEVPVQRCLWHKERNVLGPSAGRCRILSWRHNAGRDRAGPARLAVELFQNVRRRDVGLRLEAQTTQGLHNYVASAMTVVDHARRVMKGRSGPIAEEYSRRVVAVAAEGEAAFVQGLRNFTLHRSSPFLGHVVNIGGDGTVDAEFTLSVKELLLYKDWKAPAREFIGRHDAAIPLRPLIRRHGELLVELNTWVHGALVAANQSALSEVDQLQTQRNAAMTGITDLTEAARVTEAWTNLRASPAPHANLDITDLMPRPPEDGEPE